MMPLFRERRHPKFIEALSRFMVRVSALGAMWVLIDLRLNLTILVYGQPQVIQIGGGGFSDQLKGAVIALILVSGYTAVKEFWLGASAGGQEQQASMARIAENSAPVAAAAAAAAAPNGSTVKDMHVEADTVEVNKT